MDVRCTGSRCRLRRSWQRMHFSPAGPGAFDAERRRRTCSLLGPNSGLYGACDASPWLLKEAAKARQRYLQQQSARQRGYDYGAKFTALNFDINSLRVADAILLGNNSGRAGGRREATQATQATRARCCWLERHPDRREWVAIALLRHRACAACACGAPRRAAGSAGVAACTTPTKRARAASHEHLQPTSACVLCAPLSNPA